MITVTLYDKDTGKFVESRTVPTIADLHLNVDMKKYNVVEGDHAPEPPEEDPEQVLRARRNSLLRSSDWTQMPDAPLSEAKKKEWQIYRQKLRDITEADYVIWPEQPK